MTQLTNQEIFDKALFGIRAQGYKQSGKFEGGCSYRGGDDLKCAVGHCIDDETANKWDLLESDTSIEYVSQEIPESFKKYFSESQVDFLGKIQHIHDNMRHSNDEFFDPLEKNGKLFEERMSELAYEFNLVYTEPVQQL
jgi:hypothetical protein